MTWWKKLLLALLAPALFLGAAEAVLALAGVAVPRYDGLGDPGRYWLPRAAAGEPAGYDRAFPRSYKQFPEKQPLFLAEKPANGWRVFVLGESSVKGLPYETGCFSDWLRLRCAAMLPDRTVEVVNAGNAGWHATDIRLLLQESLAHQPDLLVWMVGHNEFVPHNVLDLRAELLHPVRHALGRSAGALRITHWLSSFVTRLERTRPVTFDRRHSDEEPCYGPELPLLRERFREATAGAVADARAAGVPIVLCTLPRNIRQWPPANSFFSPALRADPALRAQWDEAYGRGLAALEAGDTGAALAALDEARRIDAAPAKLHFALGRALAAANQPEQAREAWLRSLAQDGGPMRAQDWAEQAIRDVAADSLAPLVDLQALFDDRAPLKLMGKELISDNCHPNLAGHELIATALLGVLERELHVPFDRSRDVGPVKGRAALGISEHQVHLARQAESLNLVKLALQAGAVGEAWSQAHAECLDVLSVDPRAWEVVGGLGLLEGMAGHADKARGLIEKAMAGDLYVKSSYVFFWKTEEPYRKVFAAANLDMSLVEASLTPDQRLQLANRMFHATTR
jgi:lysophospholipase L1-like esterase